MSLNCFYLKDDGSGHRVISKEIHNLGWLLSNWKEVRFFIVDKSRNKDKDLLIAVMNDKIYVAEFYNGNIQNFIDRPVFNGVPIRWFGVWINTVTYVEKGKHTIQYIANQSTCNFIRNLDLYYNTMIPSLGVGYISTLVDHINQNYIIVKK